MIILSSDGYPDLFPTLEQSEENLLNLIKKDHPLGWSFLYYLDNNDTVSFGFKRFHLKVKPFII